MQRLPRRQLAPLALAGLLAGLRPDAARAAMLVGPGGGGLPLRYALRLTDDAAADSIYAHLDPATASDVVATLPFGTPVPVLRQAPGESLAFGDGTWAEVVLPYGLGWVYAALLGVAPNRPVTPPLPPPVPEPAGRPGPAGPSKSLVVSLAEQFLWAYDGTTPVLAVGCTTGNPRLATPAGDFAVRGHVHPHTFVSPWPPGSPDWYAPATASYALRFLGRDFYLHDASWRRVFGPDSQGGTGPPGTDHTGSHGCINLPYPAARFLFAWATEGTPVRVLGDGGSPAPASPPPAPGPGSASRGAPPRSVRRPTPAAKKPTKPAPDTTPPRRR